MQKSSLMALGTVNREIFDVSTLGTDSSTHRTRPVSFSPGERQQAILDGQGLASSFLIVSSRFPGSWLNECCLGSRSMAKETGESSEKKRHFDL